MSEKEAYQSNIIAIIISTIVNVITFLSGGRERGGGRENGREGEGEEEKCTVIANSCLMNQSPSRIFQNLPNTDDDLTQIFMHALNSSK